MARSEWVLPKPTRFGGAETGKESNIYGEMCTEHVPFRYLFSAKRRRNRGPVPPCGAAGRLGPTSPRFHALGRAAVGLVEEYGHLAASDATVGAYDAKNGVPCD